MKIYILRSLRYLVKLIVLIAILFALMIYTKTSNINTQMLFSELFLSTKGAILMVALLLLVATQPLLGFVKRQVKGNFKEDRDKIINTMAISGYALDEEDGDKMTFRANSTLKRALMQWDDRVVFSGDETHITMEGVRKEVVKAEYRLKSFIEQ